MYQLVLVYVQINYNSSANVNNNKYSSHWEFHSKLTYKAIQIYIVQFNIFIRYLLWIIYIMHERTDICMNKIICVPSLLSE